MGRQVEPGSGSDRDDAASADARDVSAVARRRISRRDAVRWGVVGATTTVGFASLAYLSVDDATEVAPAEVFKNDAPDETTWRNWKARGWVHEAAHYLTLGRNVQCRICPNECLLEPRDRSRCRNKVAMEGKLWTMAYGNPCSLHVDPIEKKPLFHFQPGSRAFSLATSGCSLRCLNCQNWEISQKKPEDLKDATGEELRLGSGATGPLRVGDLERASVFPDDVVRLAQQSGSQSIAYTYSEPTSYYEYMLETAKRARAAGIKNVWVTNGYINPEPLEGLAEFLDAANVDLKSFSEEIYAELNSGKLAPILATLKSLKQRGVWFEVTNLIVPRYSDDLAMIGRMCDWLVSNLGPDYPLHFSRFHPKYELKRLSPTPVPTLVRAREIAQQAGLHHVYLGNVRGVNDAETTFCPRCGKRVVERSIFRVETVQVGRDGACAHCGERIAGVWSSS